MAAVGICCLGLAAQEAEEEHVAAGSAFAINKAEVGLEDDFAVKPKVQGIYTHPVTKKEGMKASAKFLDGLGTDTAGFEWTKRIPLYDKKLLSGANKLATFTATWLEDNVDQNQPLPLALGLTSKQGPVNVLERTLHLAPPLIYDVAVEDGFIVITGRWFGTGKPKVWMEYLNAKNAVKRLKCKVEAPDGEDGRVNAKLKPVYMNPADGASKVVVLTPKLPKGVVWDDLSHVVVDNGLGLAAAATTYLITGTVSGDIATSVTVTLTGDAAMTTTTGVDGGYSFEVPAGSYTVTPSQDGYVFTPSNREVTITDADSDGNDFVSLGGGDGTYLVVDLATGTTANLTLPPPGMPTSTEYKTTKMVFRRIPAGTFTMGSPGDELGRDVSNEFQHQVTLTQDFYIGVFEVTQAQYFMVMGTWPSYFNNPAYRDTRPVEQVSWDTIRGGTWPSGDPGADTFMETMRTLAVGYLFDLPTEAQWEYACRAGTTTALNSSNNLTDVNECPNMAEVGRYSYNGGSAFTQNGDLSVGTAAVGSYLPNAWGLYDMHGNVWEWNLDWYVAELGVDPVVDPVGGGTGSNRVIHGGSWDNGARYCRSANRINGAPSYSYSSLGFRAALAPQ
jgi:formylglycine-generating enzyme required for sulfatase activity